jgi:hypothetical protein
MAINHMDNFSIYGSGVGGDARLLNGMYAQTDSAHLVADPDPVAAAAGSIVCDFQTTTGGIGVLRKVLLAARTTVGVACRMWQNKLPVNSGISGRPATFRDVNNLEHIFLDVDASGNIRVFRNDTAGNVQIGITANPVLVANAWQHIETKCVLDAVNGSVQVRVEGVPVLDTGAVRTTSDRAGAIATCFNAGVGGRSGVDSLVAYFKDLIIWDSTGAFNNNFMGSCQVYKLTPDADVALNWTPFPADGIGFDKINEAVPDDDGRYIAAPFPLPAAYKCSLTDLPVTVTSVRGVMPVHRSRKTDGGDGNIQVGLISGASTGLGADRPITTAYTYWSDVYDADPNGGVAWTRLAANALNLQLNRTL